MLQRVLLSVALLIALITAGSWFAYPDEASRLAAVRADAVIEMPHDQAWERLRDLSLAHNYVPGIVKTEITTEEREGVGASRRVYQSEDQYLNETVTEWNEGSGFTIRLHGDDGEPVAPFRRAWFDYRIDEDGADKTRLTVALRYELRGGSFGALANSLLLAGVTQASVDEVAASAKRYYESGR